MKIKIVKNTPFIKMPERAYHNDAGADVFTNKLVVIEPNTTVKIGLGFSIQIPDGYMGCIYPKSGLASKGIVAHLPPIDSGYRGEVHAIVSNLTNIPYTFNKFEKVGQLVITPVVMAEFVLAFEDLRMDNGFGSTGV